MYTIRIVKPKKQEDGTYEGTIYIDNKKKFVLQLQNAYVINTKTVNDSEHYMFVKDKKRLDDVYELNTQIIEYVKQHCSSWFKINLDENLIEDYFCSNILYKKKIGEFLKFKCVNELSEIPERIHANITMTLQQIRFYKQKFVLEWAVDEVEILNDSDIVEQDACHATEEDIPCPSEEDIVYMKDTYMQDAKRKVERIQAEIKSLTDKKAVLEQKVEKLESEGIFDYQQLSKLFDDLDILLE